MSLRNDIRTLRTETREGSVTPERLGLLMDGLADAIDEAGANTDIPADLSARLDAIGSTASSAYSKATANASSITKLNNNLSNVISQTGLELNKLKAADTDLGDRITALEAGASSGGTVSDAFASRLSTVESKVRTNEANITALNNNIVGEIRERTDETDRLDRGLTELRGVISQNTNSLGQAITNIDTSYKAADTALGGRIDTLSSTVTSLQSRVDESAGNPVWAGTQAQYDALSSKQSDKVYYIFS